MAEALSSKVWPVKDGSASLTQAKLAEAKKKHSLACSKKCNPCMSRSYTQSLIERSGCISCCSASGGNKTKDEKQVALIVSSNEAWALCLEPEWRGRRRREWVSLEIITYICVKLGHQKIQ